jgi:Flp pilus assembly protein CpaB
MFFRRGVFLPPSPTARWLNRGRLAAAAICLLLALLTALSAARTTPSRAAVHRRAVAVAARNLPAGRMLRRADVAVRQWPAPLRPALAVSAAGPLIGRRLAAPMARGEPLTAVRLVGRDLTAGLPPDSVAAAVNMPAANAAIVRPGDRIDLLAAAATDGGPSPGDVPARRQPLVTEPVVRRALVLAVLPAAPDLVGTASTQLILATTRPAAVRIAGLAAVRQFSAVVDGP